MAGNGPGGKNLVVVQLSGGNDYLNTIVPYQDGLYYDYRPNMGLKGESVIPVDDRIGFNSHMAPLKRMYDEGMVAPVISAFCFGPAKATGNSKRRSNG